MRQLQCLTAMAWLVSGAVPLLGQSLYQESHSNPISKIARIVSPKLVEVEDRVTWLDEKVTTLAKYEQFTLKYGLGFRGCRANKQAPDPTIVMDLGKEMPIDAIYLIPSQPEYLNDFGIFPLRFTLEVSNDAPFTHSQIVYRSGKEVFQQVGGIPAKFLCSFTGRYIRLSIQAGHQRGATDLFGLSEFIVISGGDPVSLNASISTTDGLNSEDLWYPEALIDGRTPLGIWHHGLHSRDNIGDAVLTQANENGTPPPTTCWSCSLPKPVDLDRIILFPYQLNRSYDASFFPGSMRIEITGGQDNAIVLSREWKNPSPGSNSLTPLVFAVNVPQARSIRIIATSPWSMGSLHINALSEIEAWSGGCNVLESLPVTREHESGAVTVTNLTDGFSSEKKIAPIHIWLDQLTQRGMIEAELVQLRSAYTQLASQSELNVSWGSAVIVGLTFLIPVFFVERRRMRSREHLDIIRKRIAADLHDDIGSNLGSISLIARTARKDLARLNGPAEIDNDLGEVESIARESSLAMRDIVWLLERKQDSIGDLVHRMRETAGRLLRGIHFTLECTSTRTGAKLTLDTKRHLFLFYKEAIHNIVKHSKATEVAIRLWDEGDQLALEITDNGAGLPVTKDRASIKIKKLEDRAEVLHGNLQVTSSEKTGTCIRLLVKRSHLTTQPRST